MYMFKFSLHRKFVLIRITIDYSSNERSKITDLSLSYTTDIEIKDVLCLLSLVLQK